MQTAAPPRAGFEGSTGMQSPRTPVATALAPVASAPLSPGEPVRRTYLSLKGIGAKFGVGERTALNITNEPSFPPARQISPRVRRWIAEEIDQWVAVHAPTRVRHAPQPESLLRSRTERAKLERAEKALAEKRDGVPA